MSVKEDLLQIAQNILYRTPQGFPVKAEDYEFLITNVFPLHPNWASICGRGVRAVIVSLNEYGSKHFVALLADGSYEKIGIYDCINRRGLKDDIEMAARNASQGVVLPALTGRKKVRPEFSTVVRKWITTVVGEEMEIGKHLVRTDAGVFFTDQGLAEGFRSFYILNG